MRLGGIIIKQIDFINIDELEADIIGYHIQNVDYRIKRAIERVESIYEILNIFKISEVKLTEDYWIAVYQDRVDNNRNPHATFFVRELECEMNFEEFKNWCREKGKSTYRYINLKTYDDQIEYIKDIGLRNKNVYEKKVVLKEKDKILLTKNKDVLAEKLGMYILDVDSRLGGIENDKNL